MKHQLVINISKSINEENGFSSLVVVILVATLLALISVSLLTTSESDMFSTNREQLSKKALYIAESGVNNYLWRLNNDSNLVDSGWTALDQGEYHLDVTAGNNVASYVVESTGRVALNSPNTTSYVTEKLRANIQKRSFLRYLYLTDFETVEGTGQNIWFTSADRIRGPIHSNDRININGNPVFEGKVTTSRTINKSGGSNPDFQQGYEENATPLEMPSTNQELKNWAKAGGYYYYGMTTIDLYSNRTLRISNTNPNSTGPTGTVNLPSNGVVYVDGQAGAKYLSSNGDVFLQGTYGGKLTIGTKNNIYITGDIRYNTQSDMLGLISENYIYINHRNQSGQNVAPNDLEIDAAIFALNHSFEYEDYTRDLRGTLTIRGAIIQRYRGPVGTFNAGGRVSGYAKNYYYDERMLYEETPHFTEPLNSGYEIAKWESVVP